MGSWLEAGIDTKGRSSGEYKTMCPKCSHTRRKQSAPCLSVNIDKGLYNCHHCGWGGSIFDGEYSRPMIPPRQNKTYVKPTLNGELSACKSTAYLQSRGIPLDVLARNRVTVSLETMPGAEGKVETLCFPFIKNGDVVNIKYRGPGKSFKQSANAEKTFYKYDDIDDKCTIIVEGELDALALEVAGHKNAISVPDGAPSPKAKSMEAKFDYLLEDERIESVEKFIIAVDSDLPGQKLEEELSRRLGRERCWKVVWPNDCKDANDVLVKHGPEVLSALVESAKPIPVEGIFELKDFDQELDNIFSHGLPSGASTGWKAVDELYSPAPGQWTLVTGIPGMGKSEWLDAMCVNLAMESDWRFAVCSPENQPISFHSCKLIEKRVGKRFSELTYEEYEEAKAWVHDYFKFVIPENRSLDDVLYNTKILVKRYGINGLVIDPYNELQHSARSSNATETEYISEFLGELRGFARSVGIHVWLVAHPRIMRKEIGGVYPVPNGYDVAGSAHFFNKADNIIAVHRNKNEVFGLSEIHVQKIRSRWLGKLGMAHLEWEESKGGRYRIPTDMDSFERYIK